MLGSINGLSVAPSNRFGRPRLFPGLVAVSLLAPLSGCGGSNAGSSTSASHSKVEGTLIDEAAQATTSIPPDTFALLDGNPIARAHFEERLALRVAWYERGGKTIAAADLERARKAVGQQLLYEQALRLECERRQLAYAEDELARRQAARRAESIDRQRHLAHIGESEASLLARAQASLREELLLAQPGAVAPVSDAALRDEYDRTAHYFAANKRYRNASVVRFWRGEGAEAGAESGAKTPRELAQDFYEAVRAPGADFEVLAQPFVEGEVPGGRGYIDRLLAEDEAHTSKWLLRKVFELDEGDVSRPFTTRDWIYVVRVDQVHGRGVPPLAGMERQLRSTLHKRALAAARARLQQDLLRRYDAQIIDDRA